MVRILAKIPGFFSNPRGVLAEGDVARMMRGVFDPPVVADGVGGDFGGERSIRQIERGFLRGFPEAGGGLAREDGALDVDDGAHVRLPVRVLDGVGRVEHGNRACFVAVASFGVRGLNARQRLGVGAQGLGFLAQAGLILLELNNQMHVGGGGGLERFF